MGIALLVYADTHQRYSYWCHQNHLSPRNRLLEYVAGPRQVQGRPRGMDILCVDPAPYWLLEDIEMRGLRRVMECPEPLIEFQPELVFDLQDTTSDYDYTAGDAADAHYRRAAQVSARRHIEQWSALARWTIFVLLLFVAAYVGFLVGVSQGA